jgi:hypothetical protein
MTDRIAGSLAWRVAVLIVVLLMLAACGGCDRPAHVIDRSRLAPAAPELIALDWPVDPGEVRLRGRWEITFAPGQSSCTVTMITSEIKGKPECICHAPNGRQIVIGNGWTAIELPDKEPAE